MGMYISRLPLTERERAEPKPAHQIIDEAIAAKGYKRRPLPDKPSKVRPQLHQDYDSRSTSCHRKAYARMVGSE